MAKIIFQRNEVEPSFKLGKTQNDPKKKARRGQGDLSLERYIKSSIIISKPVSKETGKEEMRGTGARGWRRKRFINNLG